MGSAGKGDWYRRVNRTQYAANYDRIFGSGDKGKSDSCKSSQATDKNNRNYGQKT